MEAYGADFLTPSFVICISKHHHYHRCRYSRGTHER
jgi:hypothetical protein